MTNKVNSLRKKRELVVPFEGEEKFVVPKRGGFGQPDNEEFVMIVGATRQTTILEPELTPTAGSTSTSAELPTSLSNTMPVFQQGDIRYGTTRVTTTGDLIPTTTTATTTGTTRDTRVIPEGGLTPNLIDTPISMPSNWSTVSCSELSSWITRLTSLSSGADSSLITDRLKAIYALNLEQARMAYQSNCPVVPPPPPPIPVPIPVPAPPIGGGGFGGGVGGSSEEDVISQTTEEGKGKGIPLWVILLVVVGGLYLLKRK